MKIGWEFGSGGVACQGVVQGSCKKYVTPTHLIGDRVVKEQRALKSYFGQADQEMPGESPGHLGHPH